MGVLLRNVKVLGVIFLALVVGSGWLTYAVFSKKFVSYDEVMLETSNIGLQLPTRADVKIRGVIVGEVLDFEATAEGARVTLGLFPDQVDTIDKDVTGSIVPKTLFGEKYVSLVPPEGEVAIEDIDPIQEGDVIERTAVSIEVEKVLSDLYPLLTTVQPAKINMTLNALATALEGRGDQIGENLETIDAYLKRLNPLIPQLVDDLRKTATVSDIYADVLPEVATILDNTVTTTGTLERREERLNALFDDVTGLSDSARTFLADNEDNLVRVGELGRKQLRVLARYSTEFPCLTEGLVNAGRNQAEAFRGFTLHIVLETLPRQPRQYDAADVPRLGETRGPNCLNLPNPPWNQDNPVKRLPNFDDGIDRTTGKGTSRVAPGFDYVGAVDDMSASDVYRRLLAPGLGVGADEVSDLGPLLVAPMADGAQVSLR